MQTYDITPVARIVPPVTAWTTESTQLATYGQIGNAQATMDSIARKHRQRRTINIALNTHDLDSDTAQLIQKCHPLRGVRMGARAFNEGWLSLWEVFSATVYEYFSAAAERKLRAKTDKVRAKDPESLARGQIKDFPIRSFHIADNTGDVSEVMSHTVHRITFSTTVPVQWDWVANYHAGTRPSSLERSRTHWVVGVDGEGRCNVSNMRAWRNRIAVDLKKLDLVTYSGCDARESIGAMVFALVNLIAGGCALIRVPNFAETRLLTVTHLFSNCFENTCIYHALADSAIYVCGTGYLPSNITSKHQKLLYEFLEVDDPYASLYAVRWFVDDGFITFMQRVEKINTELLDRRVDYFATVLALGNKLNASSAVRTMDNARHTLIADTFPDRSEMWIRVTGIGQIFDQSGGN